MIEVSSYQSSYLDTLVMLHETNSQDYNHDNVLPEIGFVAYEGAIPVAMGFLRQIEGGYALIDTLVTNRDLSSELRHVGISKLVDKLIETAKDQGFKGVMALSNDDGILKRADTLGFKTIQQTPIGLYWG